jgi:hypothetical protein
VKHVRENGKIYKVLVSKSEGKRPLGRAGRKRENDIKI